MQIDEAIKNNIISSRIRLARNLKNYPFYVDNIDRARDIVQKVDGALSGGRYKLYYIGNLPKIEVEVLKEKNLISEYLSQNTSSGAVLVSPDETLSIMINEEDIIREQCFLPGFRLVDAYYKLNEIDDKLNRTLSFAYDNRLGYLTACPTNLGTGMRASVMMFLPAITESRQMKKIAKELSRQGMTVRGAHGEGSKAEGFMYQISNEVTLGVDEQTIINSVNEAVIALCKAENQTYHDFYGEHLIEIKDRCMRALGILTHAVLLSYSEFLKLISDVRLGVIMKFIKVSNMEKLDSMIMELRPNTLCKLMHKNLSDSERDFVRAEEVSRKLRKIIV